MNIHALPFDTLSNILLASIAGIVLGISIADDDTQTRAFTGLAASVLLLLLVYRLFFL